MARTCYYLYRMISSITTNSIQVRRATGDDLQSVYRFICELEKETFELSQFQQIFESNLLDQNCLYYIAELEGKPVGFISLQVQKLLHHCGRVGEVQEFYIDAEVRGKGVGKVLMNEVKRYAAANDLKSLEVTSNKKRNHNVEVYQHLGFSLTHNKFTLLPL
jgi:PhnO protein